MQRRTRRSGLLRRALVTSLLSCAAALATGCDSLHRVFGEHGGPAPRDSPPPPALFDPASDAAMPTAAQTRLGDRLALREAELPDGWALPSDASVFGVPGVFIGPDGSVNAMRMAYQEDNPLSGRMISANLTVGSDAAEARRQFRLVAAIPGGAGAWMPVPPDAPAGFEAPHIEAFDTAGVGDESSGYELTIDPGGGPSVRTAQVVFRSEAMIATIGVTGVDDTAGWARETALEVARRYATRLASEAPR